MKARIGGRTTFDSIPQVYRDAAIKCVQEAAEKRWAEVQNDISTRFLATMALALNDLYGFGTVRIRRVFDAMSEIAVGYSDDSYSPHEKRIGTPDMRRMANAMLDELKSRGIRIEVNDVDP